MNRNLENIISLDSRIVLLNQQDIFEQNELVEEKRNYPLHIYLICKSPKILLDVDKISYFEDKISLNFYTNRQGEREDYIFECRDFVTNNNEAYDIKEIQCEYPYNFYRVLTDDVDVFSEGKTNLLMRSLVDYNRYEDSLNLEVLYVGQAFGTDGNRITLDRLKTHEKAQKIFFDTQHRYPDEEVWFLSITFDQSFTTVFDPRTFYNPEQIGDDLINLNKVQTTEIPFDQQITILEACLIKYFNTIEYNKEYLNFPTKNHKSYESIYELDFNSVSFSINTKPINAKLFSKSIDPQSVHMKRFFFT